MSEQAPQLEAETAAAHCGGEAFDVCGSRHGVSGPRGQGRSCMLMSARAAAPRAACGRPVGRCRRVKERHERALPPLDSGWDAALSHQWREILVSFLLFSFFSTRFSPHFAASAVSLLTYF